MGQISSPENKSRSSGCPYFVVPISSVPAWDCSIAANGNNIEVPVTGESSVTIAWVATIEVQSVATSS